jgi:hypothetical protein
MITSLALLGLIGCSEYSYTSQTQTDYFEQNARNTVDIVLVVDNSCSMVEEQEKLAANFQSFIQHFQTSESDYQIAVVTTDTLDDAFMGRFVGGDDELVLIDSEGKELDRLVWDRDWGLAEGASWSLDPSVESPSLNDISTNWCLGTTSYGEGDLGTPGAANPSCGARGPTTTSPDTGDTLDTGDGEPVDTGGSDPGDTGGDEPGDTGGEEPGAVPAPGAGEIMFTEFMADPAAVQDALGEWVELTSLTDHDVDLSGHYIVDYGRNAYAFPDGTILAAGGILVVARELDPGANGGVPADLATGAAMNLQNQIFVITPETDGSDEIFGEMVAVGVTGSGIEMGLEAVYMAFTEPNLSGTNAGFIREDANLSFIYVSDEDDSSPNDVDSYLRFMTDLKGEAAYRDHSLMSISSVVGDKPPEFDGDPACATDSGLGWYGRRYVDLTIRTDGLLESICDDDFSPLVSRLGLTLSGLLVEFELSETLQIDTLEVSLYETADEASFVKALERDVDYEYVLERNAIRFEQGQVPPASWFIKAEYTPLAVGASIQGTETNR